MEQEIRSPGRFSKEYLEVVQHISRYPHGDMYYSLLLVRTKDGEFFAAIRLHNGQNKFVKQLLMEIEIARMMLEPNSMRLIESAIEAYGDSVRCIPRSQLVVNK